MASILSSKPQVAPETDAAETVRTMRRVVKDLLEATHLAVSRASREMEYDMEQVSARLTRDGTKADLRRVRTGHLYRHITQYELLQRLEKIFEGVASGEGVDEGLLRDDED